MSGMPPPPPRPPGDMRRSALLAAAGLAAQGAPGSADSREQPPPPRDPSMALPLPWSTYFDRQRRVECPSRKATFNVYEAGDAGPIIFCLHGGGYTGLTWALLAQRLKGRCRLIAPDLRGHGLTAAADEADLAAATLAADTVALWRALCGGGSAGEPSEPARQSAQQIAQSQRSSSDAAGSQALPPVVMCGHSMGGAVAVHAAATGGIPSLAGVVVVDVVEGTALASLPYMAGVLAKRPKRFASLQQAVGWALDAGMCKRQEAAHVSLPAMLRWEAAAGDGCGGAGQLGQEPLTATGLAPLAEGEEEGEEAEAGEAVAAMEGRQGRPSPPEQQRVEREQQQQQQGGAVQPAGCGCWAWRTPLERSAPFWEGWYLGLSDTFLRLPVPKVLVLVGTDRLDRALTIGQMQGKFQPVLLPQAGHAVHEDEPDRVAEAIATFLRRFRVGEGPLAPPRPAPGLPPVLPVAMGPACPPQGGQGAQQLQPQPPA